MRETEDAALRGRRVLVVEDEYFVAEDVAIDLGVAGAEVVGPAPTVAQALALAGAPDRLDAAVLDVNLGGEMVWPVVELLRGRGVPVLLATGYDAGAVPTAYAGLPRCEKPVSGRDLLRTLARQMPAPG